MNNNAIVFEPILYGADQADFKALYYTVNLAGSVDHLFPFMERFGKLPTEAHAVVKISHVLHGESLFRQMWRLRSAETYESWDHIKGAYKTEYLSQGFSDSDSNSKSSTAANNRCALSVGFL